MSPADKAPASKLVPLADAIRDHLPDGATVFIGGFGHAVPFAAAHEFIRQGKRDLTLVRACERPRWAIALPVAMYAVIASGGKQEKVAEGQQVRVELLDAAEGSDVSLTPVMVVDGDTVLSTPDELKNASVTGRIVGRVAGPKIDGFTYKRRTNQRRRFGHRQKYHLVEITSIKS